jgi:predicted HTH domain antitoxin
MHEGFDGNHWKGIKGGGVLRPSRKGLQAEKAKPVWRSSPLFPYLSRKDGAMTITLSDTLLRQTGLTEAELKLFLAIQLFKEERLTLRQASQLAGLHQIQMQRELAKRDIPIHYGEQEFRRDMETIKRF